MSELKNNLCDGVLQSKEDMEFIRGRLEQLDDGIPVPDKLSAQYLLRRAENRRRAAWLRPALIASAAALVIVIGLAAGVFGVMNFAFRAGSADRKPEDSSACLQEVPKAEDAFPELTVGGAAQSTAREDKDALSSPSEAAGTYSAGSYGDVLAAIEGSVADFAHVLQPNKSSAPSQKENGGESDFTGVIGKIVVSIENKVIVQDDAEYVMLCEDALRLPHENVATSGGRRVYSIESDQLGPVVCIDDVASGAVLAAIKLGGDISVERLIINNDRLIVIADTDKEFGEIPLGAFGVTIADIFDISDGSAPVQTGRYACEGELFTVITDSSGVFAAVRRFAVDNIDPDSLEIDDMSYVPMFMHDGSYSRIAPSDIYLAPSLASMDYMMVFRLDGENNRPLAYLGDADPLHAVNYLLEKFK